MAFDVQTLNEAARCAECLSPNQKQNVLLYLLNGILEGGGSGGIVLHNLLSATHPDTVPGPPTRGAIVVGNATPDWESLPIGAANRVLRSDGVDATWGQLVLTTDVTGILPIANGGTNSGAALNNNRIMVSSGGAIVEAAALTDGQLLIGSTGAAPVAAGLTAGTNVTIGIGAGSITVNAVMPGGFTGFANPTASVGLAAVNGVATTAMRSDAAPPLSQAIAPTWTGPHIFSPTAVLAIQINPFGAAAGNTSELRFLELAAGGTNYTGFKAADAMAASEIYVLPDAAPSANRFLRAGAVAAGVSTLSWTQISLTADVTGILPVANGGTGTSTAFTQGSVIFAGAAGVFTQDNANFFFDNANNRLGLATAVPLYTLHVFGPGSLQYGFAAGALILGADLNATTISVNTRKIGRVNMVSYDGGATNTFLFGGDFQAGGNDIYFGGVTAGSQYAATTIHFFTGATQTTTGGIEKFTINASGVQLPPTGAAAGNTGELRFLELAAGGTNYTGFKAADAMAASEIYVLPNAAPAASRFLQAAAVAGGVSALSWAQVSLTADVTGTLPVGNGGIGITVGISGGILGFTSTTTLASSVLLTANALILGGGAGATPVPMASLGTTTTVLHGNAAGAPTFSAVSLTADVSGILPVTNGGTGTGTAFTAGSVIFAGAAGVYAQDNANFFWDDTNNRLGLGTASPNQQLELTGNLRIPATTSTVGIIFQGTTRLIHTFGSDNIFIGYTNGNFTMSGAGNVGIGTNALFSNTTGLQNTAIGLQSLVFNTTGANNTAVGYQTMMANTTGSFNMAYGFQSLFANLTGARNIGFGYSSLSAVTSGDNNVGIGYSAGDNLTTGSANIVIGYLLDSPTATNSNTLTIGNLIFGTGLDGIMTTLSSGNIGIGVITPLAKFHVTNSAAATVATIIKAAAAQSANLTEWQDSSAVILSKFDSAGNLGVRMAATALSAYLHLAAGTATASTAPLKFTSGTLNTVAVAGQHEYNGNHYLTNVGLLRFPVGGSLFDSFADASVGGAEADIFTSTLLANTFNGNGDKVFAVYGGNFVTLGTESVQLKAKFAGTTIWDSTAIAISTGTSSWRVRVELIRVSSTVIRYTVSLNTTGASGFVYAVSGELTGLTLSGTNALALTGTSSGVGSGAGDIVGKMSCVEFKPAA